MIPDPVCGDIKALQKVAFAAQPVSRFSPARIKRLVDAGAVEVVRLPSRVKRHKGQLILHLVITPAGALTLQPELTLPGGGQRIAGRRWMP